jgi:NAD(P)-dependent dehydrogenase (short-subunit alcohol dehydrogenase family)
MPADLSSQASIHHLVDEFVSHYQRLHVLINNAGLIKREHTLTADDIETTFAVNHLGSFLLTNLLLDVLKASAPARIVNVASFVHKWGRIDFANLMGEKRYNMNQAYQSKLANVIFSHELARRLDGSLVTVNCLDPGMVDTDLDVEYTGLRRLVARRILKAFRVSTGKGAETSIFLASSPDVEGVSGKYFFKREQKKSSKTSYDTRLAARLWDVSAALTKLPQVSFGRPFGVTDQEGKIIYSTQPSE